MIQLERRKIDEEEAQIAWEKRNAAIEKANKAMHDNQDQVKAFHSKMMLCDTLQEREAQKELKKKKEEIDKHIERQWIEQEQRNLQDFDIKTQKQLEQQYKKKMENAKVIKAQLYDFKVKAIKTFKEEQLEGELIKRQVVEDQQKARQAELEKKLAAARTRQEFKKANDDLQAYNAELRRKEREEEEKIALYAKKKEAMEQLRKDKEAQKFQEKLDTRQKLVDKQIEHLKTLKNREDEILNKQINEATEKANKLWEEKERRQREQKELIEKSRKQQIEKRLNEKETMKKEEKEFAEFWKIRNDELAVAEQQELEEVRQRQKELKTFIQK